MHKHRRRRKLNIKRIGFFAALSQVIEANEIYDEWRVAHRRICLFYLRP